MPIRDDVLRGSVPRLGTVTTGRATTRTKDGRSFPQPRKASGLVFHTDDGELANVVLEEHGGTVHTDSPTWGFDVEVDAREVDVMVIPGGFRQWLEAWKVEQCLRRCDGAKMITLDGQTVGVAQGGEVVDGEPCLCEQEMARGRPRTCKPSTVLPVMIDLPVERFGVWEVRTTGWTSGRQLKGAVQALWMVGLQGGRVVLPARLAAVDDTVRSGDQVHSIVGLELRITAHPDRLVEIARSGGGSALAGPSPGALPSGELPPDPSDARADAAEARARAALEDDHARLRERAEGLDLIGVLSAEWGERFGDLRIDDLLLADLASWVDHVRQTVADAEDAAERHRAGSQQAGS